MDTARVNQEVEKVEQEVIDWRRHFHRNPELSMEEFETSQYIYDTLQSFGNIEVIRPTKTSVVGRLIGNSAGKTIAIRGDIDALPIHEENTFDFVSEKPGVMHACGHDGHTAMLLGTAKVLSGLKDEINGEVRFLFEHAEEKFPGGAKDMVEVGVMEGVDHVIGAHLVSTLDLGKFGLISGPMTAAADGFWLTVKGKGGHGARPHEAVDSIVVACQVVTNLQQIISRKVDPLDSVVLTVGNFVAEGAGNVIADSVQINGIVRSFDPKYRETVPQLMEQIVKGITDAHGATYTLEYVHGFPSINNDEYITSIVEETAVEQYGEEAVDHMRPTMGAESFSYFSNVAPGTYFMVGARNEKKGIVHPHHHPKFTVDEDAFQHGMKIFVNAVFKILD